MKHSHRRAVYRHGIARGGHVGERRAEMTRSEQLEYDIHILQTLLSDLSGYHRDELSKYASDIWRAAVDLEELALDITGDKAA